MQFINTIVYSWRFLVQSAKFLKANLDLLFFPIISLVAIAIFFSLTLFSSILEFPLLEQIGESSWIFLIVLYGIIYFVLCFIMIYFNASLVACATLRLQGKEASIGDGLGLAANRWWALVKWSILGTTVGFIIRGLENSHNIIEEIIGLIIGVAWTIAAFFVIPVVIFEDVGPFTALKRSFKIFGRGWRKAIGVHFIFVLFTAAIMAILYGILYLIPFESRALIDITITLFIFLVIMMITLSNVFNSIIVSGLYLNIMKQQPPKAFDQKLLNNAFVKRENYQPRF